MELSYYPIIFSIILSLPAALMPSLSRDSHNLWLKLDVGLFWVTRAICLKRVSYMTSAKFLELDMFDCIWKWIFRVKIKQPILLCICVPLMCGRHLWKSGPLMSHVFMATARLIQATFAFAGSDETGSVLSVYHRRFVSIWVASVLFWLWA